MFTGIITQQATVASTTVSDRSPKPLSGTVADGGAASADDRGVVRLALDLERAIDRLVVGDSVAVDGVCLTVVALAGRRVEFEAIPETMRKTTLGRRRRGDRVNVEGALRVGDAIGGHLVQGHVDGVGVVRSVERRRDDVRIEVSLPEALRGATIPKGSITVDGVSLTVGESDEGWFSVYLIPHTLAATGLGSKAVGDPVNLEADVVGRYVEHHVRRLLPGAVARSAASEPSE